MACLVFFAPFSRPKTLIQDTYLMRLAGRRLRNPVTCGTVEKVLHHKCSDTSIHSVNKSWHHHQVATPAHFSKPISYQFDVSSSTYMVISGFWVGPDIEDGWGFIEAIVNQIC